MAGFSPIDDLIARLRGRPADGFRVADNPFRLGHAVGEWASADEIDRAWPAGTAHRNAVDFWRRAGSARLFVDLDHGQWGLELFDPAVARQRTDAELAARPGEVLDGDVVIGGFLGDLELVVIDAAGEVLVALPLDARSDWYRPATSFAEFLDRYVAAGGAKFWE